MTVSACFAEKEQVSFENAVFLQETKKDYKNAINVLNQVIKESTASSLEARYRLAQCYKLSKDHKNYMREINALSKEEDVSNQWVKKAIDIAPVGYSLGPAPWEDGDVLRYALDSGDGQNHIFMTMIYKKIEYASRPAWKLTTLRPYTDKSISEVIFDAETYEPKLNHMYYFYNGKYAGLGKWQEDILWDGVTFPSEMLTSLFRLFSFGTGEEYGLNLVASDGGTVPLTFEFPKSGQFTMKNAIGELKGEMMNTKIGKMEKLNRSRDMTGFLLFSAGYRTDAKNELIKMSSLNSNIVIKEITTLEKYKDRTFSITAFNKLLTQGNGNLIEQVVNNENTFKAMIYPDSAGFIGELELKYKKNLLKEVRSSARNFAKKSESNRIKNQEYYLPENTEEHNLGGFDGVLFTADSLKSNKYGYLCFYGYGDEHALSFRLMFHKGEKENAIKELKRFLNKDLITK